MHRLPHMSEPGGHRLVRDRVRTAPASVHSSGRIRFSKIAVLRPLQALCPSSRSATSESENHQQTTITVWPRQPPWGDAGGRRLRRSSMRTMIETARLMCIAVAGAMAAQVSAQTWTAPVVLSTGGQGWEAAAAIDGEIG